MTKDISIWKESFKITHFFVNPDAQASIHGLSYCLQETAVNHAYAGKFGYEQLLADKRAWVLTRQHIKLYQIPLVSQKILIESWVHQTRELISIRDFHVFDSSNNLIGLARTSWMMFDLESRKPIKIPEGIASDFPHHPDRIKEDLVLEKLPLLPEQDRAKNIFTVVYSDLDVNQHVNNIHYSRWVLDDFGYDFRKKFRLQSIENNFLSEAFYGERVSVMTIKDPDHPDTYLTNIINTENNRIILSSRTKWIEK